MPEPPRIRLVPWAATAFGLSLALTAVSVPGLPWQAWLFPLLSLWCVVDPGSGSLAAIFLAPVAGVVRDFVAVPYFAPAELVIYCWAVGWLRRRAAGKRREFGVTALDPWILLWLCVFASSGVAELRLADGIRASWGNGLPLLARGLGGYLFDYRIMMRPLLVPLAGVVVYFAAIQSFRNSDQRRRAGDVFLAATGCVALYALCQYLFGFQLRDGFRVRGGLVAINLLGSLLILGLGLSLSRISRTEGRMRWIASAVFLLNCCALLVTRSRAGWLGAVAVVSIYAILRFKQFAPRFRRGVAITAAAVLAVTAVLVTVAANVDVQDRYENLAAGVLYAFNPDRIVPSIELRMPFWGAAVNAIADHPIFGIGLGRFWSSNYIWEAIGRYRHAHNIVLNLTAELGLVGLTAWLLVIVAWCRNCAGEYRNLVGERERMRLAGLIAGVGGFLATGFTDDPLAHAEGQIFFWIVLALGMPLAQAVVWTPRWKRIAAAAVVAAVLSLPLRAPRPMGEAERQFLKLPPPSAANGQSRRN